MVTHGGVFTDYAALTLDTAESQRRTVECKGLVNDQSWRSLTADFTVSWCASVYPWHIV